MRTLLNTQWLAKKICASRVALLAQILCVACVPALRAQPAVSGRVLDPASFGLQGVTVKLQSLSDPKATFELRTDQEGRYFWAEVPDGEYSLGVEAPGFVGVTYRPIRVQFPLSVRKDFVLGFVAGLGDEIHVDAEVGGELKQAGNPLSHAKVCLSRESREACTETNGIGQYYLAVRPGTYGATVSTAAGIIWTGTLDFPNGGIYRDNIRIASQSQK